MNIDLPEYSYLHNFHLSFIITKVILLKSIKLAILQLRYLRGGKLGRYS